MYSECVWVRAICYAMVMGKRGERKMLRRNKGREKAGASGLTGLAYPFVLELLLLLLRV